MRQITDRFGAATLVGGVERTRCYSTSAGCNDTAYAATYLTPMAIFPKWDALVDKDGHYAFAVGQ